MAISDLHVAHKENADLVDRIRPTSDLDWLIVAGDVAERVADVSATLKQLSSRFAKVIWVPGNHELWTHGSDPIRLRGHYRYRYLVEICRSLGVITPEDPYPVWCGPGGPARIVPMFLLYDYSFIMPGCSSPAEGLERAREAGVVCTDEFLLHPDPYPSREAWCHARIAETERRLLGLGGELPTVLINHYPLLRAPTEVLRYPEFAQWCGTTRTADWHVRFGAVAVVYGHLHIPRISRHDGVPFIEASVGYPREWRQRGHPHGLLREVELDSASV